MTTTEHLSKIRAKCVELLEFEKHEPGCMMSSHIAALQSTIIAIDGLMHDYKLRRRFEMDPDVLTYQPLMGIIAAWPEELL